MLSRVEQKKISQRIAREMGVELFKLEDDDRCYQWRVPFNGGWMVISYLVWDWQENKEEYIFNLFDIERIDTAWHVLNWALNRQWSSNEDIRGDVYSQIYREITQGAKYRSIQNAAAGWITEIYRLILEQENFIE